MSFRANKFINDLQRLILSLAPAGMGAILQMVAFSVTSRALGAESFGVVSVIFATSQLLSPFATLGSDQVIVRALARETADFPKIWGHVLLVTMMAFPVALALAVILATWSLETPEPILLITVAIFGEMLIGRAVTATSATLVAKNMVICSSISEFLFVAVRTVSAVFVFLILGSSDLTVWLTATAAQSFVTCLVAGMLLSWKFGAPRLGLIRSEVGFGLSMMANLALQSTQYNIDKLILGHLVPAKEVGVYSAGTRLQLIGNIGILWVSRLYALGYFKAAREGRVALLVYMRKCILMTLTVGVMSAAGMACLAFLLPVLAGKDFGNITGIALIIALVPIFTVMQVPAADTLTALDRQNLRTTIYAGAVLFLIVTIIVGARLMGIYGAAWALVATAAFTTASLWIAFALVIRRK